MFGLILWTEKRYRAEGKTHADILARVKLEAAQKLRAVEADRDAANKQIERLLHNHVELTLLSAAVRECGVDKRVQVVYDRLMPKGKGTSK